MHITVSSGLVFFLNLTQIDSVVYACVCDTQVCFLFSFFDLRMNSASELNHTHTTDTTASLNQ